MQNRKLKSNLNIYKPFVVALWAVLGTAEALAQTAPQVRATVGHFAPFATSLDATSVTVRVNGNVALSNVKFGEFTEYLSLGPAGPYKIEILVY